MADFEGLPEAVRQRWRRLGLEDSTDLASLYTSMQEVAQDFQGCLEALLASAELETLDGVLW